MKEKYFIALDTMSIDEFQLEHLEIHGSRTVETWLGEF